MSTCQGMEVARFHSDKSRADIDILRLVIINDSKIDVNSEIQRNPKHLKEQ